jgi:hypothetical protein
MIPGTVIGTYTGAGVAKNIIIGFKPDLLIVWNHTDGTPLAFWNRATNADGTALDVAAAAATNADNGFSAYAGTDGAGFTAGTDYAVNAKVYAYAAFRSGPGAT